MTYLDHRNQGLVLWRPSALAFESFFLAGSVKQQSSVIILSQWCTFSGHVRHGRTEIRDKSEACS